MSEPDLDALQRAALDAALAFLPHGTAAQVAAHALHLLVEALRPRLLRLSQSPGSTATLVLED